MNDFRLERVTKYRRSAEGGGRVAVLRQVTAHLPGGGLTLIMGPSGSGKSTLLRLLNRLDDAEEGTIRLGEMPLAEIPVLEVRRRVGLVGQRPVALAGTVAENLAYGLRLQRRPAEEI